MAASCLQGPFVLQDPSGADGSTEAAAGSSAVGPAAANSQEAVAKFIDIRKKVWQGVFFFGFFFATLVQMFCCAPIGRNSVQSGVSNA